MEEEIKKRFGTQVGSQPENQSPSGAEEDAAGGSISKFKIPKLKRASTDETSGTKEEEKKVLAAIHFSNVLCRFDCHFLDLHRQPQL